MSQVALVTGGTRGIGAAITKKLHQDGFKVIANYARSHEIAEKFQKETGIPVLSWDVSDFEACQKAINHIQQEHGTVAVLVNNAGITRDGMFHKMSHEDWRAVLATNLDSLFCMTRTVIQEMRANTFGRIINISSINGLKGQLGQVNYSTAKAGVIGFTKALALENARKNVTVNSVAPGYIKTDMVGAMDEGVLKNIVGQIPEGRLGTPEEIAEIVAFLARKESAFITGATINANGGQYCQ